MQEAGLGGTKVSMEEDVTEECTIKKESSCKGLWGGVFHHGCEILFLGGDSYNILQNKDYKVEFEKDGFMVNACKVFHKQAI